MSLASPDLSPARRSFRGSTILLFVLPLLVVLATRLPYFGMTVLNEDEGLYAAVARAMQHGGLPYRDAWDHAAPGIFVLYWLLFKLFGAWNMLPVRIAAAFAHYLSSLIVGWDLRRRWGDGPAALGGAFVALALGGYLALDAISALTETFLLPFLLAAAVLMLRWGETGRARPLLTGILIALATWFKIHALFLAGALLVAAWGARLIAGEEEKRGLMALVKTLLWSAGGYLLLVLPLFLRGGFGDFLHMYIGYNIFYAGAGSYDLRFLDGTWRTFWQWGFPQFLVVALAVAALGSRLQGDAKLKGRRVILATGLGVGILLGLLGARLFGHYFLPAAAFAGWLAGEGFAMVLRQGFAGKRSLLNPAILAGSLILIAGLLNPIIYFHGEEYFVQAKAHEEGVKVPGPFPKLIDKIDQVTKPGEKIWVWGFAPEVYLLAKRDCSSRFINDNYLVGLVPWVNAAPDVNTTQYIVKGSWPLLMHDLQHQPPVAIVDAAEANYQFWGKYPMHGSHALTRFVSEHYVDAGSYNDFKLYLRHDIAAREGVHGATGGTAADSLGMGPSAQRKQR